MLSAGVVSPFVLRFLTVTVLFFDAVQKKKKIRTFFDQLLRMFILTPREYRAAVGCSVLRQTPTVSHRRGTDIFLNEADPMTTHPDLYLNKLQLQAELDRCLNCHAQPCMKACPVNCNPHEFIQFARLGRWQDAVHAITRNNPMGQTCGLICPDKFCMQACTRHKIDFSINIPRVQATILSKYRKCENNDEVSLRSQRVAIIGAGPAGIAASSCLARAGIQVDIFESKDRIGGALNLIPDSRLPHDVIVRDWQCLEHHALIHLHLHSPISDVSALCQSYDGVIVATGEPHCMALHIPGESLSISYMDYLLQPEKYQTNGAVAVIGGGNVAADCAQTAKQMGAASVEMFIRRRISDMRISQQEHLSLIAAGIDLVGMTSPEKIEQNGDLITMWTHRNICVNGKWTPLENTSVALPYFSLIIRAIGSRADAKPDVIPDSLIYAGDCKTGGSTIVEAIASGRTAAAELLEKFDAESSNENA